MCDDILRGSPYGLDFSVMAKARVIVAPPCWSTSTIPAGCATVISARLTIPGRVGPVARHIGPQDHRVVDVTTEMQQEEPAIAACARYAGQPSVADPLSTAYPILANCGSRGAVAQRTASVDRDRATDRPSPRNRRQPLGDRCAVPGAMLEVGTRGSHRGGAAVAVNRTGSRRPEGVGHVRLGESTPVHRTRLELRVPQCPTSRPCARDVFTSSPHRGPDRSTVGGCGPVW